MLLRGNYKSAITMSTWKFAAMLSAREKCVIALCMCVVKMNESINWHCSAIVNGLVNGCQLLNETKHSIACLLAGWLCVRATFHHLFFAAAHLSHKFPLVHAECRRAADRKRQGTLNDTGFISFGLMRTFDQYSKKPISVAFNSRRALNALHGPECMRFDRFLPLYLHACNYRLTTLGF